MPVSGGKVQAEKPESPEAEIYNKIHRAIAERRLLPGSRLVEDQLAEVFGVSRMRIRWVLQSLARDKVVTLHRNRGATVAKPTVKEAKEVFAARRLIEGALAREVVRATDDKALKRLKAHIKKEIASEKSHDRAMELRTSHDFHTLLAEIVGNSVLVDFLQELMARSALITAIFERPDISVCSHFTHSKLIELIENRDEQGLVDAMLGHLNEIESYLSLYEKDEQPVDIKTIFADL
ncbi:MAG TPA: GntR family transcriptional regulator [Alphaproteobacteria bacterium]|jgi:DNA-binding GntR family transcriptional regulator|nr:GntR family transcriptional regulator [Alphaproteobacteria bacterium]